MRNIITTVRLYFNKYNSSKLNLGVDNGGVKDGPATKGMWCYLNIDNSIKIYKCRC
jgi:hypothetical protein